MYEELERRLRLIRYEVDELDRAIKRGAEPFDRVDMRQEREELQREALLLAAQLEMVV